MSLVSMLADYEILTEQDLIIALDLDESTDGYIASGNNSESPVRRIQLDSIDSGYTNSFALLHSATMKRNKTIIDKFSVPPDIDRHYSNTQTEQDFEPGKHIGAEEPFEELEEEHVNTEQVEGQQGKTGDQHSETESEEDQSNMNYEQEKLVDIGSEEDKKNMNYEEEKLVDIESEEDKKNMNYEEEKRVDINSVEDKKNTNYKQKKRVNVESEEDQNNVNYEKDKPVDIHNGSSSENSHLIFEHHFDGNLCIEFNTNIGRKIFVKAIRQKYMNVYYKLPQQCVMQENVPRQSGSLTLQTLLNCLQPTYSRHQIDRTILQTDSVDKQNSWDYDDFAYMARFNQLSVEAVIVSELTSIKYFRRAIKTACRSDNIILVCVYSEDNGNKYFLPVGGYYKEKDLILLIDTTCSNVHPHWVPVNLMWRKMKSIATSEYMKNGYLLLQRSVETPTIILNITNNISIKLESNIAIENKKRILNLKYDWETWLSSSLQGIQEDNLSDGVERLVSIIKTQTFTNKTVLSNKTVASNEKCKLHYKQRSLIDLLTKTKVFSIVQSKFDAISEEELGKLTQFEEWIVEILLYCAKSKNKKRSFKKVRRIKKNKVVEIDVKMNVFNNIIMVTTWLLFWPYRSNGANSNCSILKGSIENDIRLFPHDTVMLFHEQIKFILKGLCIAQDIVV